MRDRIGQRFNGYDLHHSLRAHGHDARMLVMYKTSSDTTVHAHPRWVGLIERGAYAAERVTGLQGLLSPIGLGLESVDCYRRAELVHWHLVYPHYIGIPHMAPLARRRATVWTLHDPWVITGHCVHPAECERWRTGCGHCPDLKRNFTVWVDTTHLIWQAKQAAYRRMPVTLVCLSRWLQSLARQSPLTAHLPCHVIPPGLDLGTWRRLDRAACRAKLGIPPEARALAFRMPLGSKQEYAKGIPWLVEALARMELRQPTHLIVFEERGRLTSLGDKFVIHELGWLTDARAMVEAMTAADLFLMPSVAESAGLMALEAMACGTPVIVSDSSAQPEMVRAPVAGVGVPVGDAAALAHAIEMLLADDARRAAMGEAGRRIIETEHAYELYVRRHIELYEDVVARSARER